jgi:hypothetical protein
VKRAAFVACITTALGLAIPMSNFTRRMLALESYGGKLGTIAVILVLYVFTAIVPLFYFALYRNQADLLISGRMRWMAITGAAVIGILSIAAMPTWIGSFQRESVLHSTPRPWTIGDISTALGHIADLAVIALLAALFRLAGNGPSGGPVTVSKLLRVVTKIAVISGGIVAVGCVVGLAATPWVYSYIRDRSLEMGHSNANWTFTRLALDRVRAALAVISLYVAPFVVWRGSRTRVTRN